MKKKLISSFIIVLILVFGLTLFSCVQLIAAVIADGIHISELNKEVSILGDRGAIWRSELSYNEGRNGETSGIWYGSNIPGWISNDRLVIYSYKGVAALHIIRSRGDVGYIGDKYALVSSEDNPAGETSYLTLKVLGSEDVITYTVSYILSDDGSSFTITDLGRLNHPLLRTGTYISSDANRAANNRVLEGYGGLTIRNISSNYSIIGISVNGGQDIRFSQAYQVNLSPAGSGMAGIMGGGRFEVGDIISGKKVVPIGDYEIRLRWSNGTETTHTVTIDSSGTIASYNQ